MVKPARRLQAPGDTIAMRRRRRWAAYITPPQAVADAFSIGGLAVYAVVATVQTLYGECDFAISRIAALAGVGYTTAYNTLRILREMNELETTWRDSLGRTFSDWRNAQYGADNHTNIIRLKGASAGWLVQWKTALKKLSSILQQSTQTFSFEPCVSPP